MSGDLARVASQYAEAVIELAEDSAKSTKKDAMKILEQIHGDLTAIKNLFETNPDVSLVLNHPSLSSEDKKKLLVTSFDGKVHEITLRLLKLLADRRRLNVLPYLEDPFKEILRERMNVIGGKLISARKLSDSQVQDIKSRLVKHLGKRLELEVEVDSSLIGGLVLKLGDQVIDGSLKGKLQAVESSLLSV